MASAGPFRLLDLPTELRLRVYDLLLPIITHRTITGADHKGVPYSVSIVSKRSTGKDFMKTCRLIYFELSSHRKTYLSTAETLRVVADWRAVRGPILRTILRCVASRDVDADKCRNPESLATVFAPLHIIGGPSQGIPILRRDFSSHDELHHILRHSVSARSPVSVEIAINRDAVMPEQNFARVLNYEVLLLYNFVWYAKQEKEEQEMQIVLRRRLNDEAKDMEVTGSLMRSEYPPASWEDQTWTCKAGKTLKNNEWNKYWAEREN
jgi:hypothetical protein